MGYKVAILPTLLFTPMLQAADEALRFTRTTRTVPGSDVKVADLFRRFGADEWEALRNHFGTEPVRAAHAVELEKTP